jgi:hypothetical protein
MVRTDFTPEEGAELEKLQQELMAAKQRTAKTLRTNGAPLTGLLLQRFLEAEQAEAAIRGRMYAIIAS